MPEDRVQKLIAQAGVTSRRDAEQFIKDGRVAVNGKTATLGTKADPSKDTITVDGVDIGADQGPKLVIMLHKPEKVIVTASDPQNRPTVYALLERHAYKGFGPKKLPRVFPVGRLDYDAEGLLLLTNDGELADALAHPRRHVPKTYLVKIQGGPVDDKGLKRMRQGMHLRMSDGSVVKTQPAEIELHRKVEKNAWYSVTVYEGRNRLIKRLFQAVGFSVRRILRIDFGGLKLGDLPEGEWRALEDHEERKLRAWILDKPPAKLVSPKPNGRGQTTKAEGRSGQVPGKGARRQSARNLRKGSRVRPA